MVMLKPSWTARWTVAEAEAELPDFRWDGPGIYYNKEDSMLVMPTRRPLHTFWHLVSGPDEVFEFLIFNGDNVADFINILSQAPSRKGK